MIDIRVSRHEVLAIRQGKVHLPNHLDDLFGRILETDVDQQPFPGIMDEIDGTPQSLSRLVIHFDDVRKNFSAGKHAETLGL